MRKSPELDLLERISNLLQSESRSAAHRAGLQPVQLEVLDYLGRCNRYSDTPAGVAEFLGLTKGTVSQSILRLEEKGLIERRADPEDGRVSHLELTAEGRRKASGAWRRPLEAAIREVRAAETGAKEEAAESSEEAGSKLEVPLEALLRALQRANGNRSFGVCRSCRFFQREAPRSFRCGLTQERLSARESGLLCREHAQALPAASP